MKKKILFLAVFLMLSGASFAQKNSWSRVSEKDVKTIRERNVRVSDYQLVSLNLDELKHQLALAKDRSRAASEKGIAIRFPNDQGTFDTYEVYEVSDMHEDLQTKYSDIKSYTGKKTGDQATNIRFSLDPYFGFNAVIRSSKGIYYIESYSLDNKVYMVYDRKKAVSSNRFSCLFNEDMPVNKTTETVSKKNTTGGLMRKYRLAISTTAKYTAFTAQQAGVANGTGAQKRAAVMAAVNIVISRVNQVFENELSVTLQLVPNTDQLFFITSDTFNESDPNQMINENAVVTNNIIGSDNYDIGHLFFKASPGNDNGLASLPSACQDEKAKGVTGSANPVGDPFSIDFVAHEMGHQFGAHHTQNNDCYRNTATSVEPGSASTIMGYAGICSPDIQSHSDAYFHAVSIQEIDNWITGGGDCSVNTNTQNHKPTADAGTNRTIPMGTPFALTGSGSDPDGDTITYNWEETDIGAAPMPPGSANTVGPLFRSFWATVSPIRYFPRLSTIVEGYDPSISDPSDYRSWEKLSTIARNLNFSLMVRDNNPAGGLTDSDTVTLTVSDAAGPFVVTSQNTAGIAWKEGQSQTITWNVAHTNAAPVNTAYVTILLSTDGGLTFPHILVASTPNNGSYTFNVPQGLESTSKARIMIKAIDNVFLNVNRINFTIGNAPPVTGKADDEIKIYPNPAKGIFTIEAVSSNGISYTIFTINGRLVRAEQEVKGQKIKEDVDVSSLSSGVYVVWVNREGQKVSRKLIIKK
ncbi:reprolysin-like metallopeptidase [Chryseobacterium sp.]|uniref:zinc-dependent metalloprotease n=1 Tax=Chryseobacterium sp. TaxID=1871047 RepID=UPI0025C5172B|nr:zinc-dependent metalloprotease family protein [Chryseobacterium sp.]MBV8325504.1 T9SS type A sorting domain-containing protein [Chryseobacterium sp.]